MVDEGNKEAKSVRQDAKPVSFGLAYGAYPEKIAATIKCSIAEAEQIFNAYHNEMYPQITEYRENYVLPTTTINGEIHLGLGCKLITDSAKKDIRTLSNSTIQYWSILTLLAANKLHQLIDDNNLNDSIKITSTIYDALYFEVDDNPIIIKWLNDHLIPIMSQDFISNQIVKNDCDLCIGTSWADYDNYHLPHNASLEEITNIVNKVKETLPEVLV